MEDARSKYPLLPSNYVSIIQLRERWMREQQQIEEQKEIKLARESQTPKDSGPSQDDTPPKLQGRLKFRRNRDGRPRTTEECSETPKWSEFEEDRQKLQVGQQKPWAAKWLDVDEDRQKVEVGQQKPRAAKFNTDRRTGQVGSYNPERAEVGCQKRQLLKLGKDVRTVGDCCGKSGMEAMAVVEEEINDDGEKTAGLKKKKKKKKKQKGNSGTKPMAEEQLAGGTVQPMFKSGNEGKCPSAVNQMDGIQRRMEKLSVDPVKPEGSHGSTSTHIHMNGYQMKPRVSGRFRSRKATGAGLAWVRKGETPYG